MPAPPPESEPAIVRATGARAMLPPPRLKPSRGRVQTSKPAEAQPDRRLPGARDAGGAAARVRPGKTALRPAERDRQALPRAAGGPGGSGASSVTVGRPVSSPPNRAGFGGWSGLGGAAGTLASSALA